MEYIPSDGEVEESFKEFYLDRLPFVEIEDDELLDWDASIEEPPAEKSGTIEVTLIYKGKSEPLI